MADPVQAAPHSGMGMHGALPDMINGLGASAQALFEAAAAMFRGKSVV